jgi:Fur family ferric uptake transcriptional regulator
LHQEVGEVRYNQPVAKRTARTGAGTPAKGDDTQSLLRAAGLRSTEPRVAVLRHLGDQTAPVSHADLCRALEKDGFDRATLYRNLIDLTEVGIVTRTDLGDHVWRFELKRRDGNHVAAHPHFVCSDCGTVSCLPDVDVRISRGKRAPKSLATKDVAIQITALCDECA